MDKVISTITSLGVPGLVLLIAIGASGLSGAAAITFALSSIGPGGILGGIAFLGVLSVISNAVTEYGFEAILKGVLNEFYAQGESKESIIRKINSYPFTEGLKIKLRATINGAE